MTPSLEIAQSFERQSRNLNIERPKTMNKSIRSTLRLQKNDNNQDLLENRPMTVKIRSRSKESAEENIKRNSTMS